MTIKRNALALALALSALALAAVSEVASASHVRPAGATPLRVPLVPAYNPCLAPNDLHGKPLYFPSCDGPVQSSHYLTVGTPDANGAGANSIGSVILSVISTPLEDIKIDSTITDVRCLPATAVVVCNSTNAAAGPDYSGQIDFNTVLRITDHYNAPTLNEAATVFDSTFPVKGSCANTASTLIGGQCDIHTTANAVLPGFVPQGPLASRAVIETQQLQVYDGGLSGIAGAPDSTLFMDEGTFVP